MQAPLVRFSLDSIGRRFVQKTAEETFFDSLVGKTAEEAPPEEKEQPAVAPPQEAPKRISQRSVFSNPETHPYVLDLVMLKHFRLEWLSWLPETMFREVEQTLQTSIAEVNKLKILATQTLHVTDMYWEHWDLFEKTLWALNGQVPLLGHLQPPDLPILYAGVDIAKSIREEPYGEEVSRYCAAVFLNENVFYAPDPLGFCQKYITQPYYTCRDCEKRGSALPPFDGLCSSCGGHFDDDAPFSFKPNPEAVKKGLGKNLTTGKTYDPDPTKKRFDELNAMSDPSGSIREIVEDIQAAKLITAVDYMNHKKKQLSEQLSSLRGWLEMA
jgi:hypothetical protein